MEDEPMIHRALRPRFGGKSTPLDLMSISLPEFRYKLRHNAHFDVFFFTEVSGQAGAHKFLGPHGDEFLDSTGAMMHHETTFAAERIKAGQKKRNGTCIVVDVGANF